MMPVNSQWTKRHRSLTCGGVVGVLVLGFLRENVGGVSDKVHAGSRSTPNRHRKMVDPVPDLCRSSRI